MLPEKLKLEVGEIYMGKIEAMYCINAYVEFLRLCFFLDIHIQCVKYMQVRACHRHGTGEGGSAGKIISRLLNAAISSGKRVRHETNISKGAVSVSSAAAEFSRMRSEIDLEKKFHEAKLCIVGAGSFFMLLFLLL